MSTINFKLFQYNSKNSNDPFPGKCVPKNAQKVVALAIKYA